MKRFLFNFIKYGALAAFILATLVLLFEAAMPGKQSANHSNQVGDAISGTLDSIKGDNTKFKDVTDIKIANEFMNNANRLRNFDTVNISKAVDAASPQYALIKKLVENDLFNLLPEELQETAKMRLKNPDMSLNQLAIHSIPPISKSGITHRMSKIMKIGKELLTKYNV